MPVVGMLRQLYFLKKKPGAPCLDRVVAQNTVGTFLRSEALSFPGIETRFFSCLYFNPAL